MWWALEQHRKREAKYRQKLKEELGPEIRSEVQAEIREGIRREVEERLENLRQTALEEGITLDELLTRQGLFPEAMSGEQQSSPGSRG